MNMDSSDWLVVILSRTGTAEIPAIKMIATLTLTMNMFERPGTGDGGWAPVSYLRVLPTPKGRSTCDYRVHTCVAR